ncbi:MAG: hypothetical protein MZU91_12830 [Desulfosudis oleivorans]|nr:hypothetical protein [Desulfosudis oleivorans]
MPVNEHRQQRAGHDRAGDAGEQQDLAALDGRGRWLRRGRRGPLPRRVRRAGRRHAGRQDGISHRRGAPGSRTAGWPRPGAGPPARRSRPSRRA